MREDGGLFIGFQTRRAKSRETSGAISRRRSSFHQLPSSASRGRTQIFSASGGFRTALLPVLRPGSLPYLRSSQQPPPTMTTPNSTTTQFAGKTEASRIPIPRAVAQSIQIELRKQNIMTPPSIPLCYYCRDSAARARSIPPIPPSGPGPSGPAAASGKTPPAAGRNRARSDSPRLTTVYTKSHFL